MGVEEIEDTEDVGDKGDQGDIKIKKDIFFYSLNVGARRFSFCSLSVFGKDFRGNLLVG